MRDIKFDAIHKPTGEHIKPHELNFNNNTITYFIGREKEWCHFSLDGTYGDVILRQWTGLHDKNGKEIYEGDIVQGIDFDGDKYESLDIVEFVGGRFVLKSSDDLLDIWIGDSEIKEMEVIGNIYENPELLKEEVK